MKKFLKKFTNLVNFRVLLTIAMLLSAPAFGANTGGSARATIIASTHNMKTYKTQTRTADNFHKVVSYKTAQITNY